MEYDKKLIATKLRRWEKYLENYRLPTWAEIPDIGLYMEQVIALLKQYLDYLPPELKEEQFITSATINNYVRKKIMPEPKSKRYYRTHIAYLIMICTLKQCLSIPTLQTMIPMNISEAELEQIYSDYVKRHSIASRYFNSQVKMVAGPILDHKQEESELSVYKTSDLISACAIISGFSRLLAEKLILLEGKRLAEDGTIIGKEENKKEEKKGKD